MYVKDPNASGGLATDMAVAILGDYINALVNGEEIDPEDLLKNAPGVDRENLAELFRIARELKDVYSREYIPNALAKERIWEKIYHHLES